MAEKEKTSTTSSGLTCSKHLLEVKLRTQTCMQYPLVHKEASEGWHEQAHVIISHFNFLVNFQSVFFPYLPYAFTPCRQISNNFILI